MQFTHKGKVYILLLIASAFFAVSTITFGFFPHLGMAISFSALILLALYIKKDKLPETKLFFLISLLLALFLAVRSEEFLTLLNMAGLIFFTSQFLLLQNKKTGKNIFSIVFAPFILIATSVFSKSDYFLEFTNPQNKQKSPKELANYVAIFLTTIISLSLILPLLASANPFFKNILLDTARLLGFYDIKISESLIQWILRFLVFTVLAFNIPRMATVANKKDRSYLNIDDSLNMLLPKIAVSIVLTVFLITQLQLYFATPQVLAEMGYSLSRYTNEVFVQLSAVAFIILILLYGESKNKGANKVLTVILVFQGIFLSLMAFKSDLEYINSWGFTYKRLYGLAVASWILGIFLIYSHTFINKIDRTKFALRSLVFTGLIMVLINIANFDYLIFHFRKASTGEGVDREYLTGLSSDSLSYKNQLDDLVMDAGLIPDEVAKLKADANGLPVILYKIERLQKKYGELDIRGFNLLEYLQYLKVKNIDVQNLRDAYTPK